MTLYRRNHPEKALAAAYRVLRTGGRLAFTNWAKSEESAITIAMRAIGEKGSQVIALQQLVQLFQDGQTLDQIANAESAVEVEQEFLAAVHRHQSKVEE